MNLGRMTISELDVQRIRPLRTLVLRPRFDEGQGLEYDGDEADDAHHFAAIDTGDQRIVGVVSFLVEPIPIDGETAGIRLRGMAIDEDHQRCGIGSQLLTTTLSKIAAYHPKQRVWASARIAVTEFYAAHGFEAVGPRFNMPTVGPHQRMARHLPRPRD